MVVGSLQIILFFSEMDLDVFVRCEQMVYDQSGKYKNNQTLSEAVRETVDGIFDKEVSGDVSQAQPSQGRRERKKNRKTWSIHCNSTS